MSLATSIKDFSDTLNHIHTSNTSSLQILPFLQELVVFSVKTVISGIVYIFTFEWFREFKYLPLLNPVSQQPFEITKAQGLLFPSITSESITDSFFIDPFSHFFSFFNLPASTGNYIASGLSNSFFFSLPFSLPHLISIRRLFSQGIQAAAASLIGIVVAHSLFLISIIYGYRFLIIPWFSLEPITCILGLYVNILIIKEVIQSSPQRFQKSASLTGSQPFSFYNSFANTERAQAPFQKRGQGLTKPSVLQGFAFVSKTLQNLWYTKAFTLSPILLRIGALSFVLTWCEELNVFSCITNLTFNAQNTYLDLYPSTNASHFFGIHTIYIVSFIIGNCAFSFFFYYFFLKLGSVVASWSNLSSTKISDAINKLVMLSIITFTFASFPYYGLDYLFGKIGGFLPEDPVYKESVLSPTKLTMNKKNTLFIKAESADKKKHTSLLDVSNFDNGVYLNNIDSYKWDNFPSDFKGSIGRNTSFEKSNYRQENAWIRRNYLAKLRARPRKNSDSSSTTSFYKTFKDPKAYYQKIQLESDKKQLEKIREVQVKNPSGYFVKRREGILAKEAVSNMQDFWDRVFGFPGDTLLQNSGNKVDPEVIKRGFGSTGVPNAGVFTGKGQRTGMSLSQPKGESVQDFVPIFQQNSIGAQRDKELDLESNIFAEKYTKGIQKKGSLALLQKGKSLSTKNIIKRKFFLNPVYRALLQTDIDTFIARQPSIHNIAENQDHDLYKKRILLEKYYNWLRYYSPLQKDLQNIYNISESKSFVDSVFHHQFKGTLKVAKRLFPVTFDIQQNKKRNRVLSYDQTLYKDLPNLENPLLHEELVPLKEQAPFVYNSIPNFSELDSKLQLKESQVNGGVLPKDKESQLQKSSKKSISKKALQKDTSIVDPAQIFTHNLNDSPFIEESDSAPFYAGWDETLRRFVITNQFVIEK